jgi:hypothetical protein
MPVYIPPRSNAVGTGGGSISGDFYTKSESDARFVNVTGTENIGGVKTFTANTNFNENVIIQKDLTINGTVIENLRVEDDIIIINSGEIGPGVSAGIAGFYVDRGAGEDTAKLLFYENNLGDADNRWYLDNGTGSVNKIIYDNFPDEITINNNLKITSLPISGVANFLTYDSTGLIKDSGINTNTIQTQINNSITNYTLLTTTATLTANLQTQINNISEESTVIIPGYGVSVIESPIQTWTVSVTGQFTDNNLRTEIESITANFENRLTDLENNPIPDIFRSEVTSVSSNLQTQINNISANYATVTYVNNISINLQTNINNLDIELTTLIENVSGNLQNQIDNKTNISDLNNYTLLTTTATLTGNLQSQINSINNGSLDTRYVNITGDTMTGQLVFNNAGIQLDTDYTPTHSEGKLFYDTNFHTLAYYNDNSDITVNVGQESIVRVRNNTGELIPNGAVVCISGALGSNPTIIKADYSTTNSHHTLGVATHDISDNENGYVTTSGRVNGLNTNSFSDEGIELYLGPNGTFIETVPDYPNHRIKIGTLIRKNDTEGSILVDIQCGVDLDDVHDVVLNNPSNGDVLSYDGSKWVNNNILEGLKEPTGFENRTDSSISFDIGTLTFSISGNHNIYSHGIKYSKSSATQVINNAVGAHYIYYDLNGNLTYSQTVWDLSTNIPITYIYLDSTLTKALLFEERHGSVMDAETHRYLHFTQGAQFKSGLTIADYVLNSDTVDDNKYSITSGEIFDEDILNSIPGVADGGPYKVAYRTGVNGEWTWSTTESYPYFINANSIRYNQYTGATWQLTDITTNNRWVNYYIIASNALNDGILIIPGQAIYTSLALAQAESIASLSLGSFPSVETVAVYQVTHQFSSSYATANGRARIVAVANIKNQKINVTLTSNNNHNNLSGLEGGTTGEYFHLTETQYLDYIGKTEVSNISGNLQTQINNKANSSDLNNYTLLTTTASLTGQLQSQIDNIDLNKLTDVTVTTPSSGQLLSYNGSQWINKNNTRNIGFNILSTTVITSGTKDTMVICPFNGNIINWAATCSPSSNVILDILKANNSVPTTSIITSGYPTINNQINMSTDVIGWNTSVSANDIFKVRVNSNTNASIITLQIGINEL